MTERKAIDWIPAVGEFERNAPCPKHTGNNTPGNTCYLCDGTGLVVCVRWVAPEQLPAGVSYVTPLRDLYRPILADPTEPGSRYVGTAGWSMHGECSPVCFPLNSKSAIEASKGAR